jgi:hypothetical protein
MVAGLLLHQDHQFIEPAESIVFFRAKASSYVSLDLLSHTNSKCMTGLFHFIVDFNLAFCVSHNITFNIQ